MKYQGSILLLTVFLSISTFAAGTDDRYVSPRGKDSWPGTAAKPWKTLDHAFSRIEAAEGDFHLVVCDGEYSPSSTLGLKGISGRKVVVEAAPGASPVVMGERRILSFKKLTDKKITARLNPEAAGQVLVADLKAAGVKDFGNPCERENLVDLYWKGERQTLARYPNKGFIRAGRARGKTFTWEDKNTAEGVFEYLEDRISTWTAEKEPYVYGYFCFDWKDMYQKIASIDTGTKTITLEEPWHMYGYGTGFRYFGLNLLCELDAPGEYYIDREKGKLYWIPPTDYQKGDEVVLSSFNDDFVLEIDDCEDITIKGLTFAGGRCDGIKVNDSRNIMLEDLEVLRFGGDAVRMEGSRNVTIAGCRLETLGHSGIRAYGGDRKTLEPAGYVVTNTVAKDFSLFTHTYEPGVFFDGCGLKVDHCEFSNCSSSAMRLDASEVLVEYNYFHDLVRESDDQGVIDMWSNFSYRGVVVRYNFFENIFGGSKFGAAGVRFDDMISGQKVIGNIFRNVGAIQFGAVQMNGGKDNLVEGNVFYGCSAAMTFNPWPQRQWESTIARDVDQEKIHVEVDIDSPLYRERYPELNADINANTNRNFLLNNLAVGCATMYFRENGNSVKKNNSALFLGEGTENAKPLEYYLDPKVLAAFGLEPIPYKEIGLKGSKLPF